MAFTREEFVSIMSAFPTGVAIVTTLDEQGRPRGLTTNAICSVSTDPPLLLVCVAQTSRTLAALRHARRFVVNFMSDGRADLCALFASKAEDKFADVRWTSGLGGVPCLTEDALAYAECLTEQELEAGDHLILIG
nr:flavin reductase family protein [Actinomycetota bacterium]